MLIIGIDPGISGSICFLDNGKILDVIEMPIMTDGKKNKKQVNGSQVYNEITKRIKQFEKDFNSDEIAFYQSEIQRSESTIKQFVAVFKIVPILIIIAALLNLCLNTPTWRAISISSLSMLMVILFIDGNALSRIENYHKALKLLDLNNKTTNKM